MGAGTICAKHPPGRSGKWCLSPFSPTALVSDEPGTTRDYLTAEIDLDGVKCLLVDTAGAETLDANREGIAAAAQAAAADQTRHAQVELLCIDASRPPDAWETDELGRPARGTRVVVRTKSDRDCKLTIAERHVRTRFAICNLQFTICNVSSLTGAGLRALREAIRAAALRAAGPRGDVVAGTAVRCSESLRLAAACLGRALDLARAGGNEELLAAEVRVALNEIGKIAGTVYAEDVLDRIFSRFCIGK